MKKYALPPLSPAVFSILLALSDRPKHGYEIISHACIDSDGTIIMSTSTVYGSIKRMTEDHLIEPASAQNLKSKDKRRKYYKLTPTGRQVLDYELNRFRRALKIAKRKHLL